MSIVQQLLGEGAYRFPSFYSARYRRFVYAALLNEGTFANDPDDVGGKTIFGIASRYWKKDFKICMGYWKRQQYLEAIEYAIQFYHKNFYSLYYDQIRDESLAFKLFDFGINASPKKAVKVLQMIIVTKFNHHLVVDGILGTNTIYAIDRASSSATSKRIKSESLLYEDYVYALKTFYEGRSTFWKFGRGWFHRLRKVYNESKVNGKVKWSFVKTRAF